MKVGLKNPLVNSFIKVHNGLFLSLQAAVDIGSIKPNHVNAVCWFISWNLLFSINLYVNSYQFIQSIIKCLVINMNKKIKSISGFLWGIYKTIRNIIGKHQQWWKIFLNALRFRFYLIWSAHVFYIIRQSI